MYELEKSDLDITSTHLLGFVLGLKGAPVLSLELGYCDR